MQKLSVAFLSGIAALLLMSVIPSASAQYGPGYAEDRATLTAEHFESICHELVTVAPEDIQVDDLPEASQGTTCSKS